MEHGTPDWIDSGSPSKGTGMATQWYIAQNGRQCGPLAPSELQRLAALGQLKPQDLIWNERLPNWLPAQSVAPEWFGQPARPAVIAGNVAPSAAPVAITAAPVGEHWLEAVRRHGQRALAWDLRRLPVSPREQEHLTRKGLTEPQFQQYLAWRRSVLLVAFLPTALIAVLNMANRLGFIALDLSGLGRLWLALEILIPFAMPCSIIAAAALSWDQKLSWRIIVYGWAVSFLGPILLRLPPAHWWFDTPAGGELEARVEFGIGAFMMLCVSLPVYVVSVAFGVQRACLRLKTLLPESPVPGLFLAAAAPVFPLVLLPLFVLVNQVASSPLLILGMLLLMISPLVYLVRAGLFIRPLLHADDFRHVHATQWLARGMFGLGAAFLLLYGLSEIWFVPRTGSWSELLSGFDRKTLLGFSPSTSVWRPWDWHLIRWFLIEPLGRSLFTTLLVADLFVRIHRSVWGYSRQLASSPDAAKYDRVANMFP